ncbi:XAC2610-related protein [Siphonobacter sp.]|uniref:XAC2610-related protein n=1 Tax=Siphonobacter sp. TaxID=1869184 RepID=UPI003B3ABD0F
MFATLAFVCFSIQANPTPTPLQLSDKRFQYSTDQNTKNSSERWLLVQKGNKTLQRIPLTGPAAEQPSSEIILKDINFDGQADLVITSNRGNVNSMHQYWLYDSQSKIFTFNPVLSNDLAGYELTVDSTKKLLTAAARFSCCEHEWKTYRFVGKQLKLVEKKTVKGNAKGERTKVTRY